MNEVPMATVKAALEKALALATQARGQTAPNPMVGAVVFSATGEVLGQGFHPGAGQPHAEVFAIRQARETGVDLKSSFLAVTLEPCNHFGRTPPCLNLVLESGIPTVAVGTTDPNPLMQGKSVQKLKDHGVNVITGVLQKECEDLIRGFRSVMTRGRPFVTLKCATSLDGKIATSTGESQWITDELARLHGHGERNQHDSILVGVGTILADNPRLDVRLKDETPRAIRKIILDSQLKTPPQSKVFDSEGPVIIYCGWNYSSLRRKALEERGAVVVPVRDDAVTDTAAGGLSLPKILEDLAKKGTQELLVEGGARVLGAFAQGRSFDRMLYFLAPRLLGSASRDVFEGLEVPHLKDSVELENLTTRLVGRDILVEGTSKPCSPV